MFKYVDGAPIPAQTESEALEAALHEEMIDTGTIIAVPDLDVMRRWCMRDKHRAVAFDMAQSNALVGVRPLQFTDSESPEQLAEFAQIL